MDKTAVSKEALKLLLSQLELDTKTPPFGVLPLKFQTLKYVPYSQVIEPNAMCLATVGEGGKPSARFVLMKGYDERGVTWYTNYNRCVLVHVYCGQVVQTQR